MGFFSTTMLHDPPVKSQMLIFMCWLAVWCILFRRVTACVGVSRRCFYCGGPGRDIWGLGWAVWSFIVVLVEHDGCQWSICWLTTKKAVFFSCNTSHCGTRFVLVTKKRTEAVAVTIFEVLIKTLMPFFLAFLTSWVNICLYNFNF